MLQLTQMLVSVPSENDKPLLTKEQAERAILRASKAPLYYLGKQEKQNPELIEDLKGKVIFVG